MDELDQAEFYESSFRDNQISRIRQSVTEIKPEFECRECGEVTNGARWCSKECCDTWSKRK